MARRSPEEYSKLLRDPRWQKKRLEILERDGWKCRYCGDTESTLHIHHLWYEDAHQPWQAHSWSLLTLCESCHESAPVIRSKDQGRPGETLDALCVLSDTLFQRHGLSDCRQLAYLLSEITPAKLAKLYRATIKQVPR